MPHLPNITFPVNIIIYENQIPQYQQNLSLFTPKYKLFAFVAFCVYYEINTKMLIHEVQGYTSLILYD